MTSESSPTARALLALELVQSRPGITAAALAADLGVTERAVRRYVQILREADIPVTSERGRYGGYRIGRGHRPPPMMFTASEALGLVMAVLDGHHRAADPAEPVGSALGKLIRTLPEAVAAQAELVRRGASAAPDRSAARPDPAITAELIGAVSDQRIVRLSYRSEAGTEWESEVEPWAVVVRHGRWYLLSQPVDRTYVRAYRIDRIRRMSVLPTTFRPPADLDPIAGLEAMPLSLGSVRTGPFTGGWFASGEVFGGLRPFDTHLNVRWESLHGR